MSANFSGVPALLGNMQYSAGEITGVNAGVQYRDAMRMKNLEAALNIAAQQQAQANLDRQRQDQLRQYRDQQMRMARQDQRQAMLDQYGMQQDALANQWKERMFAESQGDKAYARGRDALQDVRYNQGLERMREQTAYERAQDALKNTRYEQGLALNAEQTAYERGRDTIKDQQWKAEMDRQNARIALEDKRYDTQAQHWQAQENRANTEMQWRAEDRAADNRRQWAQVLLNNPWSAAAASWFRQPRQTQQQKPLTIEQAREIQDMRNRAEAGDTDAQAILDQTGTPYLDLTPVESRESGWTTLKGTVKSIFGSAEGFRENATGYTKEDFDAEMSDLRRQMAQFVDPQTGQLRTDIPIGKKEAEYYNSLVARYKELATKFAVNSQR